MLNILMMMRPNALTQRGGDTVVLEKLSEELRRLGHRVTIDLEQQEDPAKYDLTHLYNFATETVCERLAKRCVERRAKYVVTTLYEDWPLFFNPMVFQELILAGYVRYGQPPGYIEQFQYGGQALAPAAIQDSTFAAKHAQVLMSSGYNESVSIRRDFPEAGRIEICHFGSQITAPSDGGKRFREYIQHDHYILCVGRLEQRKNQLSLMRALEDSDLPIVFAAGGFSYEYSYEALCRKFKRKGRNIILGRIPPELLASAFEGAAVHVLPSWYELPGLVSLEAAARGTPVVATDYGTIRDYLGDDIHYCDPGNVQNIEKVVHEAIAKGPNLELKEKVKEFNWQATAKRTAELYELALSIKQVDQIAAPKAQVLPVLIQERLRPCTEF